MAILVVARFDAAEEAAWQSALAAALPAESLRFERGPEDHDDIDVALVANPPAGALTGLSRLLLVQSLWAGVEGLLADATLPAAVPLARMVDPAMNEAMAQTALWAVLSLHRGMFSYARQQARSYWRALPQRRADEVQVLVLGLGQMGACCARRLAANGYAVSGWSTRPHVIEGVACEHGETSLVRLLGAAQVVVNLLPLTGSTRGFFNARRLQQMAEGAALVNLARGAHVVESDLLTALDGGRLAHAVLDVFNAEPLAAGHAFWHHPRVTVLPHAAAQTDARSAALIVARNVRSLREGRPLENLVDRSRGY